MDPGGHGSNVARSQQSQSMKLASASRCRPKTITATTTTPSTSSRGRNPRRPRHTESGSSPTLLLSCPSSSSMNGDSPVAPTETGDSLESRLSLVMTVSPRTKAVTAMARSSGFGSPAPGRVRSPEKLVRTGQHAVGVTAELFSRRSDNQQDLSMAPEPTSWPPSAELETSSERLGKSGTSASERRRSKP